MDHLIVLATLIPMNQHEKGPDRTLNWKVAHAKSKPFHLSQNSPQTVTPEVIGKNVRMKFQTSAGKEQWYDGIICSYNGITVKYSIYFPCDGETIETTLDDSDLDMDTDNIHYSAEQLRLSHASHSCILMLLKLVRNHCCTHVISAGQIKFSLSEFIGRF